MAKSIEAHTASKQDESKTAGMYRPVNYQRVEGRYNVSEEELKGAQGKSDLVAVAGSLGFGTAAIGVELILDKGHAPLLLVFGAILLIIGVSARISQGSWSKRVRDKSEEIVEDHDDRRKGRRR